MEQKGMIVDFHTHCFPEKLAERVIPMLAANGNIEAYLNGTVSDLLASMNRNGVDYSVMLQIAAVGAGAFVGDLGASQCVMPEHRA